VLRGEKTKAITYAFNKTGTPHQNLNNRINQDQQRPIQIKHQSSIKLARPSHRMEFEYNQHIFAPPKWGNKVWQPSEKGPQFRHLLSIFNQQLRVKQGHKNVKGPTQGHANGSLTTTAAADKEQSPMIKINNRQTLPQEEGNTNFSLHCTGSATINHSSTPSR